MRFEDIPGLQEVKQGLIDAVQKGHVAHAQMFSGPEGSANLALALAFISYLNCENPGTTDSCGTCASCQKNQKFIHPDVHFVFPVSSTTKVSGKEVVSNSFLKEWRTFMERDPYGNVSDWSLVFGGENKQLNISKGESRSIIQKLSLKAFEGGYKTILIWMPEYMNASAANGILKVLEEPSDRTLFLLVTQDQERLLGTILSRSQKVFIRAFSQEEIADELQKEGVEETRASHMARLSAGNLKLARRLASEGEEDGAALFKDWMRLCYSEDYGQMVQWADEFHKMPKISQQSFFRFGLTLMRETLISHYGDSHLIKMPEEEKEFVRNFSQVVTPEKIEPLTSLVEEASYHVTRNASSKMVFLDLSITVSRLLKGKLNGIPH